MSFLKKIGKALVPSKSSVKNLVSHVPTSRAAITNAVRNPMSTLKTGAQIGRDGLEFGREGLRNAGTVAETGFKASNQIAKNGVNVGIQGLRMGRDIGSNAIDLAKNGLKSGTQFAIGRPSDAIKTIKAGVPIAAQGLGIVKSGLQNSTRAGVEGMGVKLGNALGGNVKAMAPPTSIMQDYNYGQQNIQLQQNMQQQQAFAPQMQMPQYQGLPNRVQSGMQFGSTPNPMQQPQVEQPRQQMPVFNSGPVPQFAQQAPQNSQGMPPHPNPRSNGNFNTPNMAMNTPPPYGSTVAPSAQDRRAIMDTRRPYL